MASAAPGVRELMQDWQASFLRDNKRRPGKDDVPDSLKRRLKQLQGLQPSLKQLHAANPAKTAPLPPPRQKRKRLKSSVSRVPVNKLAAVPQAAPGRRKFSADEGWGKERNTKGDTFGLDAAGKAARKAEQRALNVAEKKMQIEHVAGFAAPPPPAQDSTATAALVPLAKHESDKARKPPSVEPQSTPAVDEPDMGLEAELANMAEMEELAGGLVNQEGEPPLGPESTAQGWPPQKQWAHKSPPPAGLQAPEDVRQMEPELPPASPAEPPRRTVVALQGLAGGGTVAYPTATTQAAAEAEEAALEAACAAAEEQAAQAAQAEAKRTADLVVAKKNGKAAATAASKRVAKEEAAAAAAQPVRRGQRGRGKPRRGAIESESSEDESESEADMGDGNSEDDNDSGAKAQSKVAPAAAAARRSQRERGKPRQAVVEVESSDDASGSEADASAEEGTSAAESSGRESSGGESSDDPSGSDYEAPAKGQGRRNRLAREKLDRMGARKRARPAQRAASEKVAEMVAASETAPAAENEPPAEATQPKQPRKAARGPAKRKPRPAKTEQPKERSPTVPELKARLKALSLPLGGTKAELAVRLKQAEAEKAAEGEGWSAGALGAKTRHDGTLLPHSAAEKAAKAKAANNRAVRPGVGRSVALHYRSPSFDRFHWETRCLCF
jgi:hypothetical protein